MEIKISRHILQATCGAVLALAVLGGLLDRFSRGNPAAPSATAEELFLNLQRFAPEGWEVAMQPIGNTEFQSEQAARILRYDLATYIRFRRPSREFSLYVAYWAAGKANARDVRHHTPDTCWVQSGWQTLEANGEHVLTSGEFGILPGQYRKFGNAGAVHAVVFWHLMNDELVPHWRYSQATPLKILTTMKNDVKRGEQYFIRISSPDSMDWLHYEPIWAELARQLKSTGLCRPRRA